MKISIYSCVAILVILSGCALSDDAGPLPETRQAEQMKVEGPADRIVEQKVEHPDSESELWAYWTDDGPRWLLSLRNGETLKVEDWTAQPVPNAFGVPGVFELDATQVADLLAGHGLNVQSAQERWHLFVRAEFQELDTLDGLVLEPHILGLQSMLSRDSRLFRSRAETTEGWVLESAWTDSDVEARIEPHPQAWSWFVEFETDALLLASFPDNPLYFTIHDLADKRRRARAQVVLKVSELHEGPYSPVCHPLVDHCLNTLTDAVDSSECGAAALVESCLNWGGD